MSNPMSNLRDGRFKLRAGSLDDGGLLFSNPTHGCRRQFAERLKPRYHKRATLKDDVAIAGDLIPAGFIGALLADRPADYGNVIAGDAGGFRCLHAEAIPPYTPQLPFQRTHGQISMQFRNLQFAMHHARRGLLQHLSGGGVILFAGLDKALLVSLGPVVGFRHELHLACRYVQSAGNEFVGLAGVSPQLEGTLPERNRPVMQNFPRLAENLLRLLAWRCGFRNNRLNISFHEKTVCHRRVTRCNIIYASWNLIRDNVRRFQTNNPTEFPTANYISATAFKRAGKTILYLADLARGLLVLVFPTARIKTERIV